MGNIIKRLEKWYSAQCDGDWEHSWGITIETLDNPGWKVTIELNATRHQDVVWEKLDKNLGENNWVSCVKKGPRFIGYGDPTKLEEILEYFLSKVESQQTESKKDDMGIEG
jgi:hypothetical protein